MNFLNRQMFQDGRDVNNNLYYVDKQTNLQTFLDEGQIYQVLTNTPIPELEALIQNPSVTYSPDTKEIFRRVVGERMASSSGVSPSNIKFGEFLPDYLGVGSGVRDIGGVIGDTFLNFAERGLQGVSGLMADQQVPKDIFVSDRYPFERPASEMINVPGLSFPKPTLGGLGPSEEGLLRRGYSNEELANILGRAQLGETQDFQKAIDEVVAVDPTVSDDNQSLMQEVMPEIVGLDLELYSKEDRDFLIENPGITPEEVAFQPVNYRDEFGKLAPITASSMSDFNPFEDNINLTEISQDLDSLSEDRESLQRKQDAQSRRADYEQAMVGMDEFGFPIKKPERSSSISDFTAELAALKPVNILKTEEDSKMEIEEKFLPTLPDIDLSITQAEADQINEAAAKDSVTTKLNEPGFFGSNRFLDFIRNVGGELTRTGDMAQGLASGAAKAAEERAARELLADQEERKYNKEMELAVAKAKATADAAGSDLLMNPDKIRELNTDLKTNMSDLEGGVAATGFVDLAIETLEEALATGESVGGFFGAFNAATDSVSAFFGSDKSFADQSAQTKIKKLVEVVRQKNLQAILGESGRTISDKDRAIILQVFGDLEFTENPRTTLGKLKASRQSLAQNNIKLKGLIEDDTSFMFTQGALGERFGGSLLPDYQRILQLDPLASQAAAILAQFMGETYYGGNIQEVDL